MKVDAEARQRLSVFLGAHEEPIVRQWTESPPAPCAAGLTNAELTRQVRDVLGALQGAAERRTATAGRGAESGELRAVLAELSRAGPGRASRHRDRDRASSPQGGAARLIDERPGRTADRRLPAYSAWSIDEMGLFTFESYVRPASR